MAGTDAPGAAPTAAPGTMPQVRMLAHFVRDLSFENVGAVQGAPATGTPEITVQVNLDGGPISDDHHQLNMKLNAKAVTGGSTRFLVELHYTGIFAITGATDAQRHPLMFIECPRLLLPFARRVVADVTRDGGYPPLMLDNVDFAVLYRQKLEELRQQQAQEEKPN